MTIRSPYIIAKPAPKTTRDAVVNLHEVGRLVEDLKALKERTQAEHDAAQAKRDAEHRASLARIETSIHAAQAHVQTIKKGDKGDNVKGDKGDMPAMADIVAAVTPHLPEPIPGKAGKDAPPVETIVAKVLAKVPPPKEAVIDMSALADSMVELFKKKKLLKIEHITDLRPEIESYRAQLAGKHYGQNTGVRGGGDTIKAGTNTTLTRNSDGTISVNALGGGSFTALAATETPNGNLKVFTFAGASAQPSYLRVDNVWMKATSASGTLNWTWNAGAKQATLAVPPVDDIEGIV